MLKNVFWYNYLFSEIYCVAKKIFYSFLAIIAVLQLFQPDRNLSVENYSTDIANHYVVPDSVEALINTVCYDCHSNNTDYPWFMNIQPLGWYIQGKINKGKSELNFSEFGTLFKDKAIEKLEDIEEVMKKNKMPLQSYKWFNKKADLTFEQRELISKWANDLSKQIAKDSLAALNKDSLLHKSLH